MLGVRFMVDDRGGRAFHNDVTMWICFTTDEGVGKCHVRMRGAAGSSQPLMLPVTMVTIWTLLIPATHVAGDDGGNMDPPHPSLSYLR